MPSRTTKPATTDDAKGTSAMTTDVNLDPGRPTGRGWAYAGAMLGGAVSVAANVAHSYVPPPDLSTAEMAEWSPAVGAVVASVFWPVALVVAVEILARTAWPAGTKWTVMRYAGLLPVALVAAVVSYRHLSGLITHYGEPGLTAIVGPLAVDGLMVMATGALIATAHTTTGSAAAIDPLPADATAPGSAAAAPSGRTTPEGASGSAAVSTPAGADDGRSRGVRTETGGSAPGSAPVGARNRDVVTSRPRGVTTGSGRGASDEDLVRRLYELVDAGELAADASTRQIQAALGVGFGRAKRVREAADPMPGQTVIDHADARDDRMHVVDAGSEAA